VLDKNFLQEKLILTRKYGENPLWTSRNQFPTSKTNFRRFEQAENLLINIKSNF